MILFLRITCAPLHYQWRIISVFQFQKYIRSGIRKTLCFITDDNVFGGMFNSLVISYFWRSSFLSKDIKWNSSVIVRTFDFRILFSVSRLYCTNAHSRNHYVEFTAQLSVLTLIKNVYLEIAENYSFYTELSRIKCYWMQ